MKLFKESKKQPIKLTNFKYIGYSEGYPNICYYYKELPRDNFELLTCSLEGKQNKPELGAGTNVKVIDVFMANYLYNLRNDIKTIDVNDFVTKTIETSFNDIKDDDKKAMIKKFNSSIPEEIKKFDSYKEAHKDNFKVLYCSNDESKDRAFGIVNLVLVKDVVVDSKELELHNEYTVFRPLRFMVSPAYLKGASKIKYNEVKQEDIIVDNKLLD